MIRAVVKSQNHPEMIVDVLENLHREIDEVELLVRGGSDGDCGENLTQFSVNDTLILALESWPIMGDSTMFLHVCGLRFLRYENGLVLGQITETLTSQPLEEFKNNILTCGDSTVSSDDISSEDLKIFPNPVSDILQIESIDQPILKVEVFNSKGQVLIQESIKDVHAIPIKTDSLEKGIYFLKIQTPKGILTRKFLKV